MLLFVITQRQVFTFCFFFSEQVNVNSNYDLITTASSDVRLFVILWSNSKFGLLFKMITVVKTIGLNICLKYYLYPHMIFFNMLTSGYDTWISRQVHPHNNILWPTTSLHHNGTSFQQYRVNLCLTIVGNIHYRKYSLHALYPRRRKLLIKYLLLLFLCCLIPVTRKPQHVQIVCVFFMKTEFCCRKSHWLCTFLSIAPRFQSSSLFFNSELCGFDYTLLSSIVGCN